MPFQNHVFDKYGLKMVKSGKTKHCRKPNKKEAVTRKKK